MNPDCYSYLHSKETYSYVDGVRAVPSFHSGRNPVQEVLQETEDLIPGVPQLEIMHILLFT